MKIPFLSRIAGDNSKLTGSKITFASTVSASNRTRFNSVLLGIMRDLPELLAVSVIDVKSGELLATYHVPGKLNPAKAAGFNAEVIRQKQKAMAALGLETEAIEDILVTLKTQWHLMRLLHGDRQFIDLIVNTRDTNLGIAREVVRTHIAASAQ